jgi:hypothetical protein
MDAADRQVIVKDLKLRSSSQANGCGFHAVLPVSFASRLAAGSTTTLDRSQSSYWTYAI